MVNPALSIPSESQEDAIDLKVTVSQSPCMPELEQTVLSVS